MSAPAASLEPRVQLDLSLEEAATLLAWLVGARKVCPCRAYVERAPMA